MQAYWNKLELDRPPTTSWRCSPNQFGTKGFLKVINAAILELESQKLLQTEAAILSRLIYRMKSKFRNDKGLKNMEKVNRALLNYLKLSLENDYKYIRDNTEYEENIQALPSRQMLQYTLVRTQGFAKLMCRIEQVAKCAAEFFRVRISMGQAWNISVVAYSVISRIWLLSRYLTKKCCDWYNRLHKYLDRLTVIGVSWLPENYQFPENLKTWLFVPWIDEEFKNFLDKEGTTNSIFSLITREADAEEDLEINSDETKDTLDVKSEPVVTKEIPQTKKELSAPPSIEIGERISREAFAADLAKQATQVPSPKKRKHVESSDEQDETVAISAKRDAENSGELQNGTAKKKKLKKSRAMALDDLQTKEDVAKFLSAETYPGLDKIQWRIIRKNVSKLLAKLDKRDGGSHTKKQSVVLKNVIRSLREWMPR